MHESHESQIDDLMLDRLVDGGLSSDDYRRMLAQLEAEPAGWRRCALAFLENQAWGQELPAAMAEIPCAPATAGIPSRSSWTQTLVMLAAMAASFLVALGLGAAWQIRNQVAAGPTELMTNSLPPAKSNLDPKTIEPAMPSPLQSPPTVARGRTPQERVMLTVNDSSGAGQQVELPVYDEADADAAMLAQQASAIPPAVLQALQRAGHDVRRAQQMVPVELRDGRRMMVPMEQIEIVPVGGRAFQ